MPCSIKMLRRIKHKVNELITERKRNKQSGIVSYSQCGEDLIIRHIFALRKIEKPSYIDIGAHHPTALSNTAFFYKRGSRGINIEANPELFQRFKRQRPNDVNLNVGIGPTASTALFYVMEDSTLSTFSESEANALIGFNKKLKKKVSIEIQTVDFVLNKYWNGEFPDFLSLDVEGLDFDIIKSINFAKSSPKVICIEASEYSPIGAGKRRHEVIDFLTAKGYAEYANTNLNAIMVKNEFWFV